MKSLKKIKITTLILCLTFNLVALSLYTNANNSSIKINTISASAKTKPIIIPSKYVKIEQKSASFIKARISLSKSLNKTYKKEKLALFVAKDKSFKKVISQTKYSTSRYVKVGKLLQKTTYYLCVKAKGASCKIKGISTKTAGVNFKKFTTSTQGTVEKKYISIASNSYNYAKVRVTEASANAKLEFVVSTDSAIKNKIYRSKPTKTRYIKIPNLSEQTKYFVCVKPASKGCNQNTIVSWTSPIHAVSVPDKINSTPLADGSLQISWNQANYATEYNLVIRKSNSTSSAIAFSTTVQSPNTIITPAQLDAAGITNGTIFYIWVSATRFSKGLQTSKVYLGQRAYSTSVASNAATTANLGTYNILHSPDKDSSGRAFAQRAILEGSIIAKSNYDILGIQEASWLNTGTGINEIQSIANATTQNQSPLVIAMQPVLPDAPNVDGLIEGNKQVYVHWIPPINQGTMGITGYQYTIDNAKSWNDIAGGAGVQEYTITGLTNGTTYKIGIRAVVYSGYSKSSEIQTAIPNDSTELKKLSEQGLGGVILPYALRENGSNDSMPEYLKGKYGNDLINEIHKKDNATNGKLLKNSLSNSEYKNQLKAGAGLTPCDSKADHLMFDPTKYNLLQCGYEQVWKTTDKDANRYMTWAVLQNISTQAKLFFVGTHLSENSSNVPNAETRRIEQANSVLAFIKVDNVDNLPVVLVGDMNTTPAAAANTAPTVFDNSGKFVQTDLVAMQKNNYFYPSHEVFKSPALPQDARHYDYIFCSKEFVVNSWSLNYIPPASSPSDHYPLGATVQFGGS